MIFEISQEAYRLSGISPREISGESTLFKDFGLSGEDYYDFLLWFSEKYRVDISKLDARILSPEESGLGSMWPKKYLMLSIDDLIKLSKFKSWEESGIEKTGKWI